MKRLFATMVALMVPAHAMAGEVSVTHVEVHPDGAGTYRFDVTLRHEDTGWDHYADAWTINTLDGTLLGTRTLYHPHVNEQPFTRSLSRVAIPDDVSTVLVRGHDSVHGFGGPELRVEIPR
jgi:hypothetical protein